jgi:hypothetical protein
MAASLTQIVTEQTTVIENKQVALTADSVPKTRFVFPKTVVSVKVVSL